MPKPKKKRKNRKAKSESKKAKGPKRGRPRKQKKVNRRRRKRGPGRPKGTGADAGKLLEFARTVTPKQLRNLAKVHRLIPRYDDLRQTEKILKRRLKAVMKKAKKLGKRIRVLTLT